ncbi:MAG: glyoxalase superfamily protein [Agitococcus sp.]|nr:glyoxalase superfamily protein [Agitococcus sp.]MDO9179321.1 glyoxalase superfamily protein [Agitococcus sp.]
MNHVITVTKAKQQAKILATYLASIKRTIPLGNALEAVAQMYGSKSWNVLSAELTTPESTPQEKLGAVPICLAEVCGEFVELSIPAVVRTDDDHARANFNAIPWFIQASDAEILALQKEQWLCCQEADAVALYMEGGRTNDDVNQVFDYLALSNQTEHSSDDLQGFEVYMEDGPVLRYCRAHRYALFVELVLNSFLPHGQADKEVYTSPTNCSGWSVLRASGDAAQQLYDTREEAFKALGLILEPIFPEWLAQDESDVLAVTPNSGFTMVPDVSNVTGRKEPRISNGNESPPAVATPLLVAGRQDNVTGTILVLEHESGSLSHEDLRRITDDGAYYVQIVVSISLSELIDGDIEVLNDTVSELITGNSGDLSDLSFNMYDRPLSQNQAEKQGVYITVTAQWDPMDGIDSDDD